MKIQFNQTKHIVIYRIAVTAFLLLSVLFISQESNAQLDPTFGSGGKTTTDVFGHDTPYRVFSLPGGKTLVAGNGAGDVRRFYLARYNSDGTLDTTYGTNGIAFLTINLSSPAFREVLRQPDGKIIFVGNAEGDGLVIRFNEDGTLDTGFANGGIHRPSIITDWTDDVWDAVIQPDGKIIVGGRTAAGTNRRAWLMRYNPNGSLDQSFGDQGGYSVYTEPITIDYLGLQTDGKIVAVASRTSLINKELFRFNANGTSDAGFVSSVFPFTVETGEGGMAVQPDNKVIVTGYTYQLDHLLRSHRNVAVGRFNSDGTTDTSFDSDGIVVTDVALGSWDLSKTIDIQADGKILVAGSSSVPLGSYFSGRKFFLLRFNTDGSLDGRLLTEFRRNDVAYEIAIQPDGKIILAGDTTRPLSFPVAFDLALARYTNVPLETYLYRGVPYNVYIPPNTHEAKADISFYRPGSQSRWFWNNDIFGVRFGIQEDIIVPNDYMGEQLMELAVFRPSNGTWYISTTLNTPSQNYWAIPWGLSGDIPAEGDYDGDTKADITVFRPSSGVWYIRHSSNNSITIRQWGLNGDKPVVGDYDGDGFDDIAVWRPSDGVWYVLKSSDNQPMYVQFGANGDKPVQADYDGDGKTDMAVWRASEGTWYVLRSTDFGYFGANWGVSTDIPVQADYDGDMKTDIAVWRPSDGYWYIYQSSNGIPLFIPYGLSTDVPVPGN